MKLVKESINFERGLDTKQALGVGEISKIKEILNNINSDGRIDIKILEKSSDNLKIKPFIEIKVNAWHWSEPSVKALIVSKVVIPFIKYIEEKEEKVKIKYKNQTPVNSFIKGTSILKVKDECFELFKKIEENGF